MQVMADKRYRKINGSMDEIRFVQRKGKVKKKLRSSARSLYRDQC